MGSIVVKDVVLIEQRAHLSGNILRGNNMADKEDTLGIVGKKIVAVRKMTKAELKYQYWDPGHSIPTVLVLEDKTKIFASQDDEGNGPGTFFGQKGTKEFYIFG